nr:hypothetical protein CFP56_68842 [Quercus suber]
MDHGLFLSHLRQHHGSSLCGHLAVVGSVRSLMPFWYSHPERRKRRCNMNILQQKMQMNSNLDNLVRVVPLCHCDADDN